MFLGEVPRTSFDLNFSFGPIPVRISPWFWLIALFISGGMQATRAPEAILGVLAIAVSILIHELGHSLAFARFGISSRIVLYQFGGLAIPEMSHSEFGRKPSIGPQEHIVIAAAGPFVQISAGILVCCGLALGGFQIPDILYLNQLFPAGDRTLPAGAARFFILFIWVSIFWALLNLVPVLPLDGGQIARNALLLSGNSDPVRTALLLSTLSGAAVAIYGFTIGQPYLAIMFGMLAYSSYRDMQGPTGGGPFGRNPW